MKRIALCVMVLLVFLSGCGSSSQKEEGDSAEEDSAVEITAAVTRDTKYDAATVSLSQEEFEAAGFKLGDGVDVLFSNGYSLGNVPFYNGYYVRNGEPVIVAYPGFENISITLNNLGIWETAGLSDGDEVTFRLHEGGGYSAVQESLGQIYSFDRKDYTSDEQFCNFRPLSGGNMKENDFYRGASPVDNSRGRAAYTDALLEEYGIRFILDLADSVEDMEGYLSSDDYASAYAASLYEEGNIALLAMSSSYQLEDFAQKLVSGLREMMTKDGPVYIHCMEGKDRTGFVCMLLEALCGASYEQMRDDYMITYLNYYDVSEEDDPDKYSAICELYFDAFVSYLHGTEDKEELIGADYSEDASTYLSAAGMSESEIEALRTYLCD